MARKTKQTGVNIPGRVRTKAAQLRVGEVQSESELFYRSIYENSSDAILLTAPDGAILEANPAACQMFGRTVEEIRQIGRNGLVDVTDPRLVIALDERIRLGEIRAEITMIRADGAKFPVEFTSKIFTNARGQHRTSMIICDITERKRTEEKLRQSQVKERDRSNELETILNSIPALVWIAHDPECQYISGNWAASEFLRMPLDANQSIIGLVDEAPGHFKVYQDGMEIPPQELPMELAAHGMVVENFEEEVVFDDGSTYYLIGNAVPLYDDQGKPRGAVAAFRDITERRRAQGMFRQEKIFAENIIETAQTIILVLDMQGHIVRFNPYLEEISGYLLDEVQGKDWFTTFLPERDRDRIRQLFLKATSEIQTHGNVNPIVTKDGREREIEWNDRILKDAQGNIVGLLSIGLDITERKRAEEALRDSELRYRTVADYTYDWEYWVDEEGKWLYSSPSCERLTGYPPEKFLEDPKFFQEIILAEDREKIKAHEGNTNNNQPIEVDLRIIHRNGEIRWIEHACQEIIIPEGERLGRRASNRDITRRKRAEAALQTSEARFSTVFHSSPLSIAITRLADNIILDVNPAWQNMTGLNHEEVIGRTPLVLNTWANPADRDRLIKKLRRYGSVEGLEFQLRKKSGAIIDVTFSVVLIEVAGEPCMLSMAFDITERKRVETALREGEERFRTLFHKSPLGIALAGSDGRFIDVNDTLCGMLGYTHKELLRKTVLDITHPDDRAMYKSLSEYVVTGSNRGYNTQKRYLRKDGSGLWVNITTAPVFNSAGDFDFGIDVIEDITVRKWAEENIRRQNLELTLLNQIGHAFNRLMSPPEILELLYTSIGQTLDKRNLYIALYDETSQLISFPIYTVDGKRSEPVSRPFGNGITEYILRTNAPLLISHDIKAFLAEHHIDTLGVTSRCYLGAPMQIGNQALGVIALQDYEREDVYEADDMELISTIAGQAALALENSRLYGEVQRELNERKQAEDALRASRDRMVNLSHRLVDAQEQERRRIAFELHDEVGQTLTALNLALDSAIRAIQDAAVREKTAGLKDMVLNLINQVSALSMEMHPRDLDALGLVPGLISLFRRLSIQTGIEIDFKHARLEQTRFTSEIEVSAYRIVQEALTNVIRHSGVKKASVRLQVDGDSLWIQVQDEGQGFDLQKDVNVEDSMGLLSMMERADQIGGRLNIETAPGEGANITCTLPLR